MRDNKFKKIQERLVGMRSLPTVGVFVDVDSVYDEVDDEEAYSSLIATAAHEFAESVGRVTHARVYYETGNIDPPLDHRDWSCYDFVPVPVNEDTVTGDQVNLPLLFDAHELGQRAAFQVCVLMVGATNYNELVKRLIGNGITVILISNYARDARVFSKDSCVYVPIHSVVQQGQAQRELQRPSVDVTTFDFKTLVQLLADSENLMPFVGAKYFVNRVMWRLKQLRTHDEKQAVFQEAAQQGIIEIYETDNVEGQEHAVSACRLRRNHPLVMESLGVPVEDAAPDTHITVTIEGRSDHPTATFPADHLPTL